MPPPVVLDRYVLQRRLGSGAFGTVWLARDERLERDVAVKMLPRERIMGGRFEREARVAARLSHPGIVTLYEASMDDEGAYLVSELVRGLTLDRLLDEGRLSDQDILDIGISLCDALEHAHGEGIVHRDVKPSNILIPERASSSAQKAKLTDFGVARVVGGDTLTRTGDIIGTLAYMAPEQAEGLEAGPSADLYSLALVLYEALTGINPAQTPNGTMRNRRLGTYLPPLRRQRRDLPRALGAGIDMALRPRARERGRMLDLRRHLVAAYDLVGDEPGVVGDAWTTRERTPAPVAAPASTRRPGARATDDASPDRADSPNRRWVNRALAALGAAAAAAWLSRHALAPAPVPSALAALACAAVTLILPRIAWLTLTVAAAALTTAQGHPGLAMLIVAAGTAPVLLIPWRATAWPLPAGAVVLGLVGAAGAWPALASWASSLWRRAALGALGWVWLLLAAPIAAHGLYLDWLPAAPAATWGGSLRGTVSQVVMPLVRAGVLAPAAVWAAAAAVLPWLVRGRSLALDAILVVIWSATVVSACTAVIAAVNGAVQMSTAPDAVLGAVAGALIALARVWLPQASGVFQGVAGAARTPSSRPGAGSGAGGQFP
ncbi:MAG TPA: serine/threonine-protein kinase [Solirubrobacteraceae bacterium]|nr:serine/threonine-protein kinase [Solirubrobacteraceae bacterium]